MIPILATPTVFVCPNCPARVQLDRIPDEPVLHPCAGLAGFLAPMVAEGTDCKVESNEREDYIAGEDVRLDGAGRPVMNVTTTYADGHTDCVVFAPSARSAQ